MYLKGLFHSYLQKKKMPTLFQDSENKYDICFNCLLMIKVISLVTLEIHVPQTLKDCSVQ